MAGPNNPQELQGGRQLDIQETHLKLLQGTKHKHKQERNSFTDHSN